ncbi:MAG: hypothetical protein AAF266_11310 [Planctomycetota bacterium]
MEDRPEASDRTIGLSDTLVDEEVAYRPVNVLAVVGLILALASFLALASRWLLLVPVVAAITSLAAANKVRRDPDTNSGFGLAAAGLAISLLVLGAVVVQQPVAQMLHARSSGVVAEAFVDRLSEGDFVGAYELTLPFDERRPTPELAEILYDADEAAKEKLEEFTSGEVAKRLSAADAPEPKQLEHAGAVRTRGSRYVTAWTFLIPGSGGEADSRLQVRLERPVQNRFGGTAWRVTDADFARR